MHEDCGRCRFWRKTIEVSKNGKMHGECRRFPPVNIQFEPYLVKSTVTEVAYDYWCGEFKRRKGIPKS